MRKALSAFLIILGIVLILYALFCYTVETFTPTLDGFGLVFVLGCGPLGLGLLMIGILLSRNRAILFNFLGKAFIISSIAFYVLKMINDPPISGDENFSQLVLRVWFVSGIFFYFLGIFFKKVNQNFKGNIYGSHT